MAFWLTDVEMLHITNTYDNSPQGNRKAGHQMKVRIANDQQETVEK